MPLNEKHPSRAGPEQAPLIGKEASHAFPPSGDAPGPEPRADRERVRAFENWLAREVAPVFDAMKADPGRGIPAEDVFAEIRTRHADRIRPRT